MELVSRQNNSLGRYFFTNKRNTFRTHSRFCQPFGYNLCHSYTSFINLQYISANFSNSNSYFITKRIPQSSHLKYLRIMLPTLLLTYQDQPLEVH